MKRWGREKGRAAAQSSILRQATGVPGDEAAASGGGGDEDGGVEAGVGKKRKKKTGQALRSGGPTWHLSFRCLARVMLQLYATLLYAMLARVAGTSTCEIEGVKSRSSAVKLM